MSQVSRDEPLNAEAMEVGETGRKGGKEPANIETSSGGGKQIINFQQNEPKDGKEGRKRSRSPENRVVK